MSVVSWVQFWTNSILSRWKRETRIRNICGRVQGEVAYYAPCGKKLKKCPDVMKVRISPAGEWFVYSFCPGPNIYSSSAHFILCKNVPVLFCNNSTSWSVFILYHSSLLFTVDVEFLGDKLLPGITYTIRAIDGHSLNSLSFFFSSVSVLELIRYTPLSWSLSHGRKHTDYYKAQIPGTLSINVK